MASAQIFGLFLCPHLSPHSVSFCSPSASPNPLRLPATLNKFIFVIFRFFGSHPMFLVSNLQAPVTGLEASAEAHGLPESSSIHLSISHPKERRRGPGVQVILACRGSSWQRRSTPNRHCLKYPLRMLVQSHQPTLFATHNTSQ